MVDLPWWCDIIRINAYPTDAANNDLSPFGLNPINTDENSQSKQNRVVVMIQLMKKRIYPETMEILYDQPFSPESPAEDFEIKGGKWYGDEAGWLIGENRENSADMVMSQGEYFGDVLVKIDAVMVLKLIVPG